MATGISSGPPEGGRDRSVRPLAVDGLELEVAAGVSIWDRVLPRSGVNENEWKVVSGIGYEEGSSFGRCGAESATTRRGGRRRNESQLGTYKISLEFGGMCPGKPLVSLSAVLSPILSDGRLGGVRRRRTGG